MSKFLTYWRGITLALIGSVGTIWLAATGQLNLYIHPRYVIFSVVLAVIATMLLIAAFVWVPQAEPADDHAQLHAHPTSRRPWASLLSGVLVAGVAFALLVLPPSTLSPHTAVQRAADTDLLTGTSLELNPTSIDTTGFSVKDWSNLLAQGADLNYLGGKPVELVGFITPDSRHPTDLFEITRFVVTCCVVDAQPRGVPVYLPGWQERFAAGDWVQASGSFQSNPDPSGSQPIALVPTSMNAVAQPSEPYVY